MKNKTNPKTDAQELYEKAKKIAYKKQVSTDSILNPMLVKHGYQDSKGVCLITHVIEIGVFEDTAQVPTKDDI